MIVQYVFCLSTSVFFPGLSGQYRVHFDWHWALSTVLATMCHQFTMEDKKGSPVSTKTRPSQLKVVKMITHRYYTIFAFQRSTFTYSRGRLVVTHNIITWINRFDLIVRMLFFFFMLLPSIECMKYAFGLLMWKIFMIFASEIHEYFGLFGFFGGFWGM